MKRMKADVGTDIITTKAIQNLSRRNRIHSPALDTVPNLRRDTGTQS